MFRAKEKAEENKKTHYGSLECKDVIGCVFFERIFFENFNLLILLSFEFVQDYRAVLIYIDRLEYTDCVDYQYNWKTTNEKLKQAKIIDFENSDISLGYGSIKPELRRSIWLRAEDEMKN